MVELLINLKKKTMVESHSTLPDQAGADTSSPQFPARHGISKVSSHSPDGMKAWVSTAEMGSVWDFRIQLLEFHSQHAILFILAVGF